MVQLNFDASTVAPNTGFEPVPEGWYNVAIRESEIKPTKDGEGAYLQLKAIVIDGPHANKPIFIRLNVQNKNKQAVDIAYGELSAICHVTGVYRVQDSSQLHNIPFQVRVVVTKGENGNSGNDVKAYKDAMGNDPGKAGAAPAGNAGAFGGMQQQPPAQQGFGVQPGAAPAFGGAPAQPPAGWGAPAQPGPAQGQPPAGWGQQPAQQPGPAQQPPAGWGAPAQGQQPAPGGNPAWGGGAPTQAAQQPPAQPGPGGWTQQQPPAGGAPGDAPWGAPQG